MKRTLITLLCAAVILSGTNCASTSSTGYMGTMVGADLGGTLGEAIGWMLTDRHDGPGKAMLGSVVGTVAGAVIGNQIAANAEKKAREEQAPARRRETVSADRNTEYHGGYQTGGGHTGSDITTPPANSYGTTSAATQSLIIGNATYQDEDGDGRCSRYETISVAFEVTNVGTTPATTRLSIGEQGDSHHFVFSDPQTITIQPHQTVRYRGKAVCKSRPADNATTIALHASSDNAGATAATLRIRYAKK